ncbi:MAG: acyl-ACP--UDP-N-acetylglucosamine O-acyltransferase [Puniceicoccaceae bacterium]
MDYWIHKSAVVEEGVEIGQGTEVGPFCHLRSGSVLGKGCRLETGVILYPRVLLGEGVVVGSHAVLGDDPQFVGFDRSIPSGVSIGKGTVVRAGVTVHRSILPGGVTRVGEDCYLMTQSHVGHDAMVGSRVVVANACQIAGHVEIGDDAFLGGGSLYHQFVRIGGGVMIAGGAVLTKDIAPHLLAGERNRVSGLNLVGLRRRGVSAASVRELKRYFQALMKQPGPIEEQARAILKEGQAVSGKEGQDFLRFCVEPSRRGIAKGI